ncbi:AAA family ATPase [Streptomyces sp. IBSBF 2953]|nr:AAA family ATPase [Streptomyces hayashii]
MSHPRPSRAVPGGESDTPYPVDLGTHDRQEVPPELLAALEELSAALARCLEGRPSPTADALLRLSEADVEYALNSTRVSWRRHLLHALRIPMDGTKVNRALCHDVLTRIRRDPETPRARQAAWHLSLPVLDDLARVGRRHAVGPSDDNLGPLTHRWTPALLQLTVWSHLKASAEDAPVWAWALQQPWLVETDVAVQSVREAAHRVVELAQQRCTAPQDDVVPHYDTAAAIDGTADASAGLSADPLDADQLEAALARITDALNAAAEPARRTAEAVAAQARPSTDDLNVLREVTEAFDSAARSLKAHGATPTVVDLPHFRKATDAALTRLSTGRLRRRLAKVAQLECTPGDTALAQDLETARDRAGALVGTDDWDAMDQVDAEALDALLTMVERHATGQDHNDILALLPTAVKGRCAAYPAGRYSELRLGAAAQEAAGPAPARAKSAPSVPVPAPRPPASATRDASPAPSTSGHGLAQQRPAAPDDNGHPDPESPETASPEALPADLSPRPPAPEPRTTITTPTRPSSATSAPVGRTSPIAPPNKSAAQKPQATQSETHTSLAELISAERYGLAAALAVRLGEPSHRITALQLAACADAVHSASSESLTEMRGLLAGQTIDELTADRPDAVLSTAALLRTVLVTGDPEVGASLSRVANGVPPSLAHVADEVAQRALKSLLLHSPPLALARDRAELERALEDARDECRRSLEQVPTIRFPRGQKIAHIWWDPEKGLIGSLLRHAADDNRHGLDALAERVRELRDSSVLQSTLDKADREFMAPGARTRLEGSSRQDLLRHTAKSLAFVDRWVRQMQQLTARDTDWSADQVHEMRTVVLRLREGVLRDVQEQAVAANVLTAAALDASVTSLSATFALLAGETQLDETELSTELVLRSELLKIPGTVIGEAGIIQPPADVSVRELVEAGGRSWEEAVRAQVSGEVFATAHRILDLWANRQLPLLPPQSVPSEDLCAHVAEAGRRIARELRDTRERLEETLRHARVDGALNEEQERLFERRLRDADPRPDGDLAHVRRTLVALSEELNRARAGHAAKLRTRLGSIDGLPPEDQDRVEQLIDAGDLLTADELISHLVNGESIPDIQSSDRSLAAFFPDVPKAMADTGVCGALIDAVRQRTRYLGLEALDYSSLSPEIAEQTAQALAGWANLAARKGRERTHGVRESELLMPALRLIGYGSKKLAQRIDTPRSLSYRFIDVPAIEYTGSALVPAFGSGLRGSLRVMLVWDRPSSERLMSWIQQDPNDDSLLVAYFGTLPVRDREVFAAHVVGGRRALVVLDDAALAHLAACGNQRLDSAMRALLPFSAVNPYVMGKRAPVAEEMFYGRDTELDEVLSTTGEQVVFGGRGLGKSALLKAAGRKYEAQLHGARLSLLISLDSTFTGTNAPSSVVWDRIGRRLLEREEFTPSRKVKSGSVLTREHVLADIQEWLRVDPKRRLLIMLDEADGFFESDSPQFTETRFLRDLGADTGDRVKVVFAGLHSVQRYAKIAENSPFGHLSQNPTAIGPLPPQDAVDLLTKPLEALGYRFEEPALVHRILGHCSYQPFLLQMFAHRLVQTLHGKRTGSASGPPYTITRADVETVQSDKDLRFSITEAFHDTLRLDARYNVIANVVAHHAHHYGLDSRLSQVQLREECTYWWHEGFENLDTDRFRAYLSEMEGLGVLAPDPDHRGWHLRSANALSMIGNLGTVEAELAQASNRKVPEHFSKFEARRQSRNGYSHSPLTADQIADVLPGHGNQARLIIGTPATGVERVAEALRDVAEATGWVMPQVSKRSDFDRHLLEGTPGRKRAVVSDLTEKSPRDNACLETLESAVGHIPHRAGVTRSAVIVAGPNQSALWSLATSGELEDRAGIEVLTLRRFSPDGLRAWAQDKEAFTSDSQTQQLQEVTGGWPLLIDRLSASLVTRLPEDEALRQVVAGLEDAEGARKFLAEAGLVPRTPQWIAYRAVTEFMTDEGMSASDLLAAVEAATDGDHIDAAEALGALRALQVFDSDTAGRHRLEGVLHTCWHRVHAS